MTRKKGVLDSLGDVAREAGAVAREVHGVAHKAVGAVVDRVEDALDVPVDLDHIPQLQPKASVPGLPDYVDAPWDPSCPVPGVLDRAQMYTAYLPGSFANAQRLADRFLTAPTGGAFSFHVLGAPDAPPIIPFVVNQCFLTAAGDTPDGSTARLGWARYAEAAFVLPVWIEPADQLIAMGLPPLQFFMPYVWVTLSPGMASGRESWGYRKTLADITFPVEAPPHVVNLHVETLAQFRSLKSTEANVPLVRGHIPKPDMAWSAGSLQGLSVVRFLEDLAEGLGSVDGRKGVARISGLDRDIEVIEALALSLETRSVWALNLKQFRDAGDTRKACYQALVSSPITIAGVDAVGALDARKIQLELGQNVRNYDVAGDFGFAHPNKLDVTMGLYADVAVAANPGRVIWSAGSWAQR